jgi:hypothetical protein
MHQILSTMKTLLIHLILAASLAASFTPASAFADFSAKDRAELEKTHANATTPATQYPAHVDWAKFVAAHYAEDAKLLPPNAPMFSGSAGILAFFQSLPPVSVFKPSDDEIVGDGIKSPQTFGSDVSVFPPRPRRIAARFSVR